MNRRLIGIALALVLGIVGTIILVNYVQSARDDAAEPEPTTSVLVEGLMSEEEIERVAAELESDGKSKWVIEQELVDEAGRVVATSTGTYFGLSR